MVIEIYTLVEVRQFSWNCKFGGCTTFDAGLKLAFDDSVSCYQ